MNLNSPFRISLFAIISASTLMLAAVDPARLQQAHALFDQGKLLEAKTAFSAIAAEDPNLVEAQRFLGLIALRRNEADEAVRFAERAWALDPSSGENAHLLGDAYGVSAMKAGIFAKIGWARKCKAAYEKAVALDPKNIGFRWSLMEYYIQAPGFIGGSIASAHEQADQIAKLSSGAGRFAKSEVFAVEKKFDEAFAPYIGVLAAEPPDYAALDQFGRLALITNQHCADAIKALQKCLTLPAPAYEPNHVAVQYLIGRLHELLGDKVAARATYRAALALDASFTPATDALKHLQ